MTLLLSLTLTVLLQRNTRFFSSLCCCSLYLSATECNQIFHSFQTPSHSLVVIVKAKAEAWQTTCFFLSPKSNPKSVYFFLRSIAGCPSSSSFYAIFPNWSFPRKSASVHAAYLRSHFSVSQPKTLHRRARGYLPKLHRAMCPEEFHLFFFSPFCPTKFLTAASNLSSFTATGPDKVVYLLLKLSRSGMDFLLHIFNLSSISHAFPSF